MLVNQTQADKILILEEIQKKQNKKIEERCKSPNQNGDKKYIIELQNTIENNAMFYKNNINELYE